MSLIRALASKKDIKGLFVFININEVSFSEESSLGIRTGIGICTVSYQNNGRVSGNIHEVFQNTWRKGSQVYCRVGKESSSLGNGAVHQFDNFAKVDDANSELRVDSKSSEAITEENPTKHGNIKTSQTKLSLNEDDSENECTNVVTRGKDNMACIKDIKEHISELSGRNEDEVYTEDGDFVKHSDYKLRVICGDCNMPRSVVNYCVTCQSPVCAICNLEHRGNMHEFVINIIDDGEFKECRKCDKHTDYTLDIFCLLCEQFICVVCKLLAHVKHDFLDISSECPDLNMKTVSCHQVFQDSLGFAQLGSSASGVDWNICKTSRKRCPCVTLPCYIF